MLRLRLLTALVAIPILVGVGWVGEPLVTLFIGGFVLWGAAEFFDLAERAGYRPLRLPGIAVALLFLIVADVRVATNLDLTGPTFAFVTMALVVGRMFRPDSSRIFDDWAVTLAGATYTGWLMAHWVLLRDQPLGREWSIFALLTTFASDAGAYFAGRAFGRHKLAGTISPKKTWEGAVGSLVTTPLSSAGLIFVLGLPVTLTSALALGVAVSVGAQLGDLGESALKRAARVKDAGGLIPGHGGLLDRTDSLAFVAVLVYYLVSWFSKA